MATIGEKGSRLTRDSNGALKEKVPFMQKVAKTGAKVGIIAAFLSLIGYGAYKYATSKPTPAELAQQQEQSERAQQWKETTVRVEIEKQLNLFNGLKNKVLAEKDEKKAKLSFDEAQKHFLNAFNAADKLKEPAEGMEFRRLVKEVLSPSDLAKLGKKGLIDTRIIEAELNRYSVYEGP